MTTFQVGERVRVIVPEDVPQGILVGYVTRIMDPAPEIPSRTIEITFDDPLVFGGYGRGWLAPSQLEHEDTPVGRYRERTG